jgi:pimeloyl-ACP methyl ester carboxylesterase
MKFRLQVLCVLSLSAGLALTPAGASAAGTVSCATFAAALRDTTQKSPFLTVMQKYSSTSTNSANGQTIRFLAVQPTHTNSGAYETLVFFNGTSQITPDWPVGMIVSGATSLCDNNALVFSDYPGIGETAQPADADFTFDNISANVYNLLAYLNDSQGFNIKSIDPTGWSLGTEAALKFTALAGWNHGFTGRGMKINKLFLIATKPGGDLDSPGATPPLSCSSSGPAPNPAPGTTYYNATGNQAMCVTSILDRLIQLNTATQWAAAVSLKDSLVGVLFPYVDLSGVSQSPYGPGDPGTICAASVSTTNNQVTSMCDLHDNEAVLSACNGADASCLATQKLFEANRSARPYLDNISSAQFAGQRRLNFTYDYGACQNASTADWASQGCAFNPSQVSNSLYNPALEVNGAPCRTIETTSAGSPAVMDCQQFAVKFGGVYIFNGMEDMFVRHDYGTALCNWFNSAAWTPGPCTQSTYSGAGHGVQYVYPSQIYAGISGALGRPR